MLSQDVTVDVVPPTTPPQPEPTLFDRCQPPSPASIPSGFGIYVLLMAPASGYRERAPKSGLGTEGIVTGCGEAFAVDGVRFRIEKLEPTNISGIDDEAREELNRLIGDSANAASRSMLRNLIAHYCFGTPELARFPADPFARSGGVSEWLAYGAIDDLERLKRITGCDVPLGLFLWHAAGVAFLDLWAVRRAIPCRDVASNLPLFSSDRSLAVGRARLLQFQQHLRQRIDESATPASLRASANFRFLPPAGLLPLQNVSTRGVGVLGFLSGRTFCGPVHVEGARLRALLDESVAHASIDLSGHEMVWVYLVRENRQEIDLEGPASAASYAIFASGHMPNVADARLDVNRWNYSNYGSLLIS